MAANKKYKRWIVEYADGHVGTYSTPEAMTRRQVEQEFSNSDVLSSGPQIIQLIPSLAEEKSPKAKKGA